MVIGNKVIPCRKLDHEIDQICLITFEFVLALLMLKDGSIMTTSPPMLEDVTS